MRCTRCDRIAVPQAVGIDRRGLVVFGWCVRCLAEQGCRLVDVRTSRLSAPANFRAAIMELYRAIKAAKERKHADVTAPRSKPDPARRLVVSGIAGLLALWSLVFMAVGVVRMPRTSTPNPMANGWSSFLLVSAGAMALTSLAVWSSTLDPARVRRVWLRTVQVAATVLSASALVWGLAAGSARRAPLLVAIGVLAAGVAWVAHRAELRLRSLASLAGSREPHASDSGGGGIGVRLEDEGYEAF